MPAPIEYGVQIADPTQAFLSAFQAGTSIQDTRFKQEQQVQQAAQQKLIQEGFTKLRGPNATAADYANLSMMLPETQAKAVRESFGMLSGERQQVALREAGEVFSAFKSGKPEIAITRLDRQIEGKRNAGDEAGAKFLETWRDVAKQDPTAAEVYFGSTISQIPGGDKVIESAIKLGGEKRAEALAPSVLKKSIADQDKALVEAKLAIVNAPNDVAKADAQRRYEEAKATKEKADADVAAGTVAARIAEGVKVKLAPSVQESIDYANLTPEQKTTFDTLQIAKKPPAAVTNINVNNLEKTAEGELGKLIPDLYEQANSAATQIEDIPRYRKALTNAITGPLANARLTANQIGESLGFTGDKRINATRELIQGLAEMGLKSRSMLTGQGAITENEQALLLKARSGDISFTKGELETILNVSERAAKAQYDKSKSLLSSASGKSPTAQMFLDNVKGMPEAPSNPNVVTVGNKTYTRPAGFTDAQWGAYKQSMGVQ